jgi:hypothetical protein
MGSPSGPLAVRFGHRQERNGEAQDCIKTDMDRHSAAD